jgi:hypothetical protein
LSTSAQPTGLALPRAFRDDLFQAINSRVAPKFPVPSAESDNLAGSHNAVRYRLRACADYSNEFVESVLRYGDAPAHEERYRQERALFGFFVSGIAALDSFSFFLHFAAAHIRPTKFPTTFEQVRQVSLKSTAKAFGHEFSNETMAHTINNLISDARFKEWERFRNVLAHRSAPGRNVYASVGSSQPDPAADWKIGSSNNVKIDPDLTPPRLVWLVSSLNDLVIAADQFTLKYF